MHTFPPVPEHEEMEVAAKFVARHRRSMALPVRTFNSLSNARSGRRRLTVSESGVKEEGRDPV